MKNRIVKILSLIFVVSVCVCAFCIVPSAQVSDTIQPGEYIFNPYLTLPVLNDEQFYLKFTCAGVDYNIFYISFADTSTGYFDVNYEYSGPYRSDMAYTSDDGFFSPDFRYITVTEEYSASEEFITWFNRNVVKVVDEPSNGIYYDIYDILSDTIYNGNELDNWQRTSVTLIATCFAVVVLALPLIIVFWLTKFLFSILRSM